MQFPDIDPVAFSVLGVSIYWYGVMYLLGFIAFLILGKIKLKKQPSHPGGLLLEEILTFGVLGLVIGGRLGYVLFYNPSYYLANPFDILKIWSGGMSFHGGLLGVIGAIWLLSNRRKVNFFLITDFIAPLIPIGLGLGRLGNFVNGELWGRVSDLPWAMVFYRAGDATRHPSQLYEFFLEGLLLFGVLWFLSLRKLPIGWMSGFFLIGYGSLRFFVEFFREPDAHLGILGLGMSMGQWLCIPMFMGGAYLIFGRKRVITPAYKALPQASSQLKPTAIDKDEGELKAKILHSYEETQKKILRARKKRLKQIDQKERQRRSRLARTLKNKK